MLANIKNGRSNFLNLHCTASRGQKCVEDNIDCTTISVPKLTRKFIPFFKISVRSFQQEIIQIPSCDAQDEHVHVLSSQYLGNVVQYNSSGVFVHFNYNRSKDQFK